MSLTEQQIRRFARHILLPEVGGKGQERLLSASVRVTGEGALSALADAYLQAAGVATTIEPGTLLRLEIQRPGLATVQIQVIGQTHDWTIEVGGKVGTARAPQDHGRSETCLLAASLAAFEALRVILNLGTPERVWHVDGLDPALQSERAR